MITLKKVKIELDLSGESYDYLLLWLIDAVEGIWDTLTNKTWASTTHTEFYNGSGTNTLYIDNYPITAIQNISVGKTQGIQIKNTTSGATASISVNSTGLVLTLNGTSDSTVLFATYTTLTLVNDAINALGSNWVSSVYSNESSKAATELIPVMGLSCHEGYTDIHVPDDFLDDFTADASTGQVMSSIFTAGFQNVRVKYTAGYTSSTCPDWLKQILIRQVSHWYMQATEKRWHVDSMHLGDGGTISYNKGGKNNEINLLPDFVHFAGKNRKINV